MSLPKSYGFSRLFTFFFQNQKSARSNFFVFQSYELRFSGIFCYILIRSFPGSFVKKKHPRWGTTVSTNKLKNIGCGILQDKANSSCRHGTSGLFIMGHTFIKLSKTHLWNSKHHQTSLQFHLFAFGDQLIAITRRGTWLYSAVLPSTNPGGLNWRIQNQTKSKLYLNLTFYWSKLHFSKCPNFFIWKSCAPRFSEIFVGF